MHQIKGNQRLPISDKTFRELEFQFFFRELRPLKEQLNEILISTCRYFCHLRLWIMFFSLSLSVAFIIFNYLNEKCPELRWREIEIKRIIQFSQKAEVNHIRWYFFFFFKKRQREIAFSFRCSRCKNPFDFRRKQFHLLAGTVCRSSSCPDSFLVKNLFLWLFFMYIVCQR